MTTTHQASHQREIFFDAPAMGDDVMGAILGYIKACWAAKLEDVTYRLDTAHTYAKIVYLHLGHASAFAFVNMKTGDIYRAASWKKPGSLLGNLARGGRINHLPC